MAAKKFKSKGIVIPVIGHSDIDVQSVKDLPNENWKEFYVGDFMLLRIFFRKNKEW